MSLLQQSMSLLVQTLLIILATILLLISLILNGLIIKYLNQKDQVHKTAFDIALVSSMWAMNLYVLMDYITIICMIFPILATCSMVIGFAMTRHVVRLNLGVSTTATIFIKFCYIRYSRKMLGASDKKIFRYSLIGRLILMAIIVLLNFLQPAKGKPLLFSILLENAQDCEK